MPPVQGADVLQSHRHSRRNRARGSVATLGKIPEMATVPPARMRQAPWERTPAMPKAISPSHDGGEEYVYRSTTVRREKTRQIGS